MKIFNSEDIECYNNFIQKIQVTNAKKKIVKEKVLYAPLIVVYNEDLGITKLFNIHSHLM